jgi:hypothetical protein
MRALAFLALSAPILVAGCALSHERAEPSDDAPRFASSASLAIDASFLYWADAGRGGLVRVPRGGGSVEAFAHASPGPYTPITVTEHDALWVDLVDRIEVWRVPLGGPAGSGATRRVAIGNGGPIGIAADATHAYFSREGDDDEGFALIEVALATGEERIVAPDVAALGIVIDGEDLVGTSCAPEGVWRISRATGELTVLTTSYCPITIALEGDDVYFSDYAEPTNPGVGGIGIFRAPRAGGPSTRVMLSDGISFAVHRGRLFVARDGSILQVARDGSATALAPATDVRGIAVDEDFVYWTHGTGGAGLELELAPIL